MLMMSTILKLLANPPLSMNLMQEVSSQLKVYSLDTYSSSCLSSSWWLAWNGKNCSPIKILWCNNQITLILEIMFCYYSAGLSLDWSLSKCKRIPPSMPEMFCIQLLTYVALNLMWYILTISIWYIFCWFNSRTGEFPMTEMALCRN